MFLISTSSTAQMLTLEDTLKLARENAPELEEYDFDRDQAEFEISAIDGLFDPTIFGSSQIASDKTEGQNSFTGDERRNLNSQVGIRKLYNTGTSTQLSYGYDRIDIDFAPLPPGTPNVGGQKYNPGITNKIEALVSQPLLRNFNGREIDLQKEAAATGSKAPLNMKKLHMQAIQLEVEQLYLTASRLKQQISLTEALIKKTERFSKLVHQRTTIGRADQVDVATAESAVVAQEGRLLSLKIALDETLMKLGDKIGNDITESAIRQNIGAKTLLPLPPSIDGKELAFALENRFDLKNLADAKTSFMAQSNLMREQDRPTLNAFVSAARVGLDNSYSESFNKLHEKNHSQLAIGLKFEMNLGSTGFSNKNAALLARVKKIEAQERTIASDVKRKIRLARLALSSSRKQALQAEKHIKTLKRQEAAERKKFLEARTDEIGAVRFEIEALSAESSLIEANYIARTAEANIRFALHAYPTEVQK